MPMLDRLTITLPPNHDPDEADRLQAALAVGVSHGWEEQSLPTGEWQCIVHNTSPAAGQELAAKIGALFPAAQLDRNTVEEKNWVEAWKEFFTPVKAGKRFLVLAPWMKEEAAAATRTPIIIEPKTAFGTGHHATTALCLGVLSSLADQGLLHPGMRFLDLGCGSGILGIAAATLGLHGDGLDIETAAVENSEENRAGNGVAPEAFKIYRGSLEPADGGCALPGDAHGPYDIILANILAGPLRELAPLVNALPGPDGKRPLLVLSGILDLQADAVAEAYTALGFPEPERSAQGEWVALTFR